MRGSTKKYRLWNKKNNCGPNQYNRWTVLEDATKLVVLHFTSDIRTLNSYGRSENIPLSSSIDLAYVAV